jgi:hypothetical protein
METDRVPITVPALQQMKRGGRKIAGAAAWDDRVSQVLDCGGADNARQAVRQHYPDLVSLWYPPQHAERHVPKWNTCLMGPASIFRTS